jgi:hypothetical protein
MKICNGCQAEVGDMPNDEPCPHCGAMSRRTMIAEVSIGKIGITGIPPTVRYRQWNNLLDSARRFYDSGEYGVAVIVAATACEVVVERAMTGAFTAKGVADLEEPVMELVMSCALSQPKNRNLYAALTGDAIHKKGFWQGYLALVQRRNRTVHTGEKIAQVDAQADLEAAEQFVGHVERRNRLE